MSDILRILRCFDALFYAFLALVFFLTYDIYTEAIITNRPSIFMSLPVLGVALATLALPSGYQWPRAAFNNLCSLKILALITAGLTPFIVWHVQGTDSVYLTIGAGLAFVAACLYLITLLRLLENLFRRRSYAMLIRLTRLLRSVTGFALLTPIATVYIFVISDMVENRSIPVDVFYRFWVSLPPGLRIAIPVFLAVYACLLLFMLGKVKANVLLLLGQDQAIERKDEN
ncbi:MAG: hypothetical protein ACOCQP_00805 [Lentisphaeria bacterium]